MAITGSTIIWTQQTTTIKVNVLPIILNGYGGSIEHKVFKQYYAELGYSKFDRIFLKLEPTQPRIENPFREQHIYLNIIRNIQFANRHFLQFGTQVNLYSRKGFSQEFINAFTSLNGEPPNSKKEIVGSLLLGYKTELTKKFNIGFQLAYNLRDKTEVRSAFSVTVAYALNSTLANKETRFQ